MNRYTPPFHAFIKPDRTIIITDARGGKVIAMQMDNTTLSDAIEVARLMTLGAEAEERDRKP